MLQCRKRENSWENGEFFQIENFSSRKLSKKRRFTRFPGKFPVFAVLIYPPDLNQVLTINAMIELSLSGSLSHTLDTGWSCHC